MTIPTPPAMPAPPSSHTATPPDPRALLRHLFELAVARAQPAVVLPAYLPEPPRPDEGRTVVIGAGKAGGAMAQALEAAWPSDHPLEGVVLTRHGHVPPRGVAQAAPRLRIVEAGHPVPDQAGIDGTRALLASLEGLTAGDLVVALMSGGGSALLTQPWPGATLADEQDLHRQLLRSGAPIGEMNTVRRHLSPVKGGRLAARCGPARVCTLAISDVPGDSLADIASGPTVPDASTCVDALAVIARYKLRVPDKLMQGLRDGTLETPKPGDAVFARHEARLIATPQGMLDAAAQAAMQAGWAAYVLSDRLEGEAADVGRMLARTALDIRQGRHPRWKRPCILLSGGETTVTLPRPEAGGASPHPGSGGRNSESMLAAALALQGSADDIWMLAADTDGIDGHGRAAGAFIAPDTLARARHHGLDAQAMLATHDSGLFFQTLKDAVMTGPTHTNVNDFRAVLIL